MCVALQCLSHAYFFQLSRFIVQCSSFARESYQALSHQLFFRYRNAILSAPEKAKAIACLATEVQQKPGELWQEALSLVPCWLWAAPKQVEAPQHHLTHLCELIFPWRCPQSMFLPCVQQGGDMDANPFFASPPPPSLLPRLGWGSWMPVWLSSASWAWSSFCFQTLLLLPACFLLFVSSHSSFLCISFLEIPF